MRKLIIYFLLITFLFSLSALSTKSNEKGIKLVKTQIKEVLLFASKAEITRQGKLYLTGRQQAILISPLPVKLDPQSIRIKFSNKNIKIKNIVIENKYRKNNFQNKLLEAENKLKLANSKLNKFSQKRASIIKSIKLLSNINIGEKQEQKENIKKLQPEKWNSFLLFLYTRLSSLYTESSQLDKNIEDAWEDVYIAKAKVKQYSSLKGKKYKVLKIVLQPLTFKSKNAIIKVSYIVAGASWYPSYELKANPLNKSTSINAFALVKQETGEDWTNVKLSFSAAEVANSMTVPKLRPYYIAAIEKNNYSKRSNAKQRAARPSRSPLNQRNYTNNSEAFAGMPEEEIALDDESSYSKLRNHFKRKKSRNYLASGKRDKRNNAYRIQGYLNSIENELQYQKKDIQKGNFRKAIQRSSIIADKLNKLPERKRSDLNFFLEKSLQNKLKAVKMQRNAKWVNHLISPSKSSRGYDWRYSSSSNQYSISSDNSFNKVPIFTANYKAKFFYESAPKIKEETFFALKSTNTKEYPLLEGPVSVFLQKQYMGLSQIKTTSPGESFKIYLGYDEDISISRTQLKKQSSSGLFVESNVFDYSVELKVKNNKTRSIKFYLFDSFPFTKDKNIEIEFKNIFLQNKKLEKQFWNKSSKNLLKIDLKLSAQSVNTIRIEYSIKYPKDNNVNSFQDEVEKW